MNVLVIDDERPARRFLMRLLRDVPDVNVIGEAADGVEAIRLIDERHPDLVFLDLVLPELDGISLAQFLARRPGPVVIVVTAFDRDERLGAVDVVGVLTKPVNPAALRRLLSDARRVLAERAASQPADHPSTLQHH